MRTIVFLIFFSLLVSKSWSQLASDPVYERFTAEHFYVKNYLNIGSSVFSSPNSVLSWYKQFLLFHFTEREMTDNLISSLKDENHFGTFLNNDLYFSTPFNNNFSWGIGVKNSVAQYLDVNRDAVKLFLLGNSGFEGQKVDFSPFYFNSFAYQKAYLSGTIKKLSGSADIFIGINIGYIKGAALNELTIDRGSLFTAQNGDTLNADVSFLLHQSNPDKKGVWRNNGKGFSAGTYAFCRFKNKDEIYFALNDAGLIRWNSESVKFAFDTSFSFSGVDLLSKNPFSTITDGLLDTFTNYPENAEHTSYNTSLAFNISMVYKMNHLSDKFGLSTGFSYTHIEHLIPQLFLNADFKLSKSVVFKPGFSFDSYQNPGFNFELEINPFQNLKLIAGTFHLENPLLTKMNGQSWYFSLSTAF